MLFLTSQENVNQTNPILLELPKEKNKVFACNLFDLRSFLSKCKRTKAILAERIPMKK